MYTRIGARVCSTRPACRPSRSWPPSDFEFAVKASRYITHIKRLRNVADEIALFNGTRSAIGTEAWSSAISASANSADRHRPFAGLSVPAELRSWAARVRALAASGKEVYLYFNNDWEGFALRDAATITPPTR
jgi:uncharacterized protein YecE (DUF72 family)